MSCNDLVVSTQVSDITISSAGEIHGHVVSATSKQITYGNTGAYGPDARVAVYKSGNPVAVLEVQQNYCFLEAGTVTVKVLSGKCQASAKDGAFSGGLAGQVMITAAG